LSFSDTLLKEVINDKVLLSTLTNDELKKLYNDLEKRITNTNFKLENSNLYDMIKIYLK